MMNNDKISMPSSDETGIVRFGLSIIFIVFGLIGGWMAFAPLASSSVAMGKVSADLNKKTIQHLEGGIIEKIYVKDGDKVLKDQVLIKLKDVQIKAQLDILKSQYADALGLYSRLKSLKDDLKTIEFSSELTDKNIIKNQTNIFETIRRSIVDENKITLQRIEQLGNQTNGLQSLIKSKNNRLDSINEEIAEWEILYKKQLVDKQKIRDLSRESNMIVGDLASTTSEIAKIEEQKNEIKTQKMLREKEFQKETLNKYIEVKSALADIKSKMIATKDSLERTSIKAPTSGVVVGLAMHTIGGVVGSGQTLLELIPQDSKLLVIAQVQTTDIDKVRIGLHADIIFSAFNLKQVNVIQGKVLHVSADSFIDEVTGMPYYEAKLEVTKEGENTLKENNFVLVSGMPAQAMINTGERTTLSYIVKPFKEMLQRSFNEE